VHWTISHFILDEIGLSFIHYIPLGLEFNSVVKVNSYYAWNNIQYQQEPWAPVADVNFPNQLFIINRLCFLVEKVIIVREDDGKEN